MGHMPLDEHATFGSLDQDVLANVLKIPAPALEINRFHNVIEVSHRIHELGERAVFLKASLDSLSIPFKSSAHIVSL